MPRQGTGDRLRQLLAMLPWLAERGRVATTEVAERFGLTEAEVVRLLELAACCGLPPYTPDQLMELIVADGWVTTRLGHHLSRPQRLTAAEGFTVAASARAILAVPGADPDHALARALVKLEAVLGTRLAVTLDEPALLEPVRRAAAGRRSLELSYYAESRDELTWRRVDATAVFARQGHWYLDGWCHSAGGRRLFRVDRIRSVRPADDEDGPAPAGDPALAGSPAGDPALAGSPAGGPQPAGSPAGVPGAGGPPGPGLPDVFAPGPEARYVTLAVPARARWVWESYPTQAVEEMEGGRLRVVMAVGGLAWLERLLLRLGPDADVLDPPDLADAGRRAASRLLSRYQS